MLKNQTRNTFFTVVIIGLACVVVAVVLGWSLKQSERLEYLKSSADGFVFTSLPNPIQVCGPMQAATTLSWNLPEEGEYRITQDSEAGSLVAIPTGTGSLHVPNVADNTEFFLRRGIIQTRQTWKFVRGRGWTRVQTATTDWTTVGQVRVIYTKEGCSAEGLSKLHVRTSRSFMRPGENYYLYAVEHAGNDIRSYNGQLDFKVQVCPAENLAECTEDSGEWGNYTLVDGKVRVDLSADIGSGIYKAQFRPRGSNWQWSNLVQVNIGTTAGLEDMSRYWLMPTDSHIFEGRNSVTGQTFSTRVGFTPATENCSWMPDGAKTMYFIKDKADGYWNPNYNAPHLESRENLRWHIATWATGLWHDEYLTALGHQAYMYTPGDTSLANNFRFLNSSYRYGSNDPKFPGYILSPRWAGPGWGLANDQQTYFFEGGATANICDLGKMQAQQLGNWVVHADMLTVNLPKYSGYAMRIKFWEMFQDGTMERFYVENWYFIKDQGLVRIEQKIFGNTDGQYIKVCREDPDCYLNLTMQTPMIEMTRQDFLR